MEGKVQVNRLQQFGISCYFTAIGIVLGNWTARIPSVKSVHGLSDALFGVILVCSIVGACLCLPMITPIINRFGSRAAMLVGCGGLLGLVPVIGITEGGIGVLIVGMFGLGFGYGMMDVSCNAQASVFEKKFGSHSMGLFHACYTFGGFLGSLMGGLLAEYDISPFKNFVLVSLILAPICVAFSCQLYSYGEEKEINANEGEGDLTEQLHPKDVVALSSECISQVLLPQNENEIDGSLALWLKRNWNILMLGGIASLAAFGEGSMNDWSTIFLTNYVDAGPLLAASGFAAFELTVTLGRVSSDYLVHSIGSVVMLRYAGLVSAGGMALLVVSPLFPQSVQIPVAVLALAVLGVGISVCSPLVVSLVSRLPDCDPVQSITIMATCVYLSVLAGPPLIGGFSAAFGSLQWALLMDACLILGIAVFGFGISVSVEKQTVYSSIDEKLMKGEENLETGDLESTHEKLWQNG